LVLGDELIDGGLWPENAKTFFEQEKQHDPEVLEKMAQIFRENLTSDGQEWEMVSGGEILPVELNKADKLSIEKVYKQVIYIEIKIIFLYLIINITSSQSGRKNLKM
jgi:hypothetical protein